MVKNGMCFHHDVLYNINLQKSHFQIFLLTSAQISRGISTFLCTAPLSRQGPREICADVSENILK